MAALPHPARIPPPLPDGAWRFLLVPHTHWDREWHHSFEQLRVRLARTVDEVVDVCEADPGMRFTLDGQCVLLEDYAEVRPPGQVERLLGLIRRGQVAVGPAYVLPDEFLVGGESLIRNVLHGAHVCERFGVEPARIGYQPDTFGHIAQLPQLLRGLGLDHCFLMRGLGDDEGQLGAVFDWVAPDGSSVLAIRLLDGYGVAASLGVLDAAGAAVPDPADWPATACETVAAHTARWAGHLRRSGLRDVLLCNGVDHRRIQSNLQDIAAALRAAYPQARFEIGTFRDHADRVLAQAATLRPGRHEGELTGGRLHTVTRGIDASRMWIHQANDACERALYDAEALCALARLAGAAPYPRHELRHAWRQLLRNHPHDSICGCSIDQVHRDMRHRFDACREITGRLSEEALTALAGDLWSAWWRYERQDAPRRSVVNTLPYARTTVCALPVPDGAVVRSATVDGAPAACQHRPGEPRALVLVGCDGLAGRQVALHAAFAEAPAVAGAAHATGPRAIANGRYEVAVRADGSLEVRDRADGRVHAGLLVVDDEGDRGDSYTPSPLGDAELAAGWPQAAVTAAGPARAELTLRRRLELPCELGAERDRRVGSGHVDLTVRIGLDAGSDRIDVTVDGVNAARDHRLRLRFDAPDARAADGVRVEDHFAVLTRPCRPPAGDGWKEPPQPTGHTDGGVAAGSLAVLTAGLPEYEALVRPDGGVTLAITLLRCFGRLSVESPMRPYHAGPAEPTPDAQEPGPFHARLALRFGALGDAGLVRAAQALRHPLAAGRAGADPGGTLTLGGHGWAISAIKRAEAEDAIVVRAFNPGAAPAELTVGGAAAGAVARTDLTEVPREPLPDGRVTLDPYEIVTLAVTPGRPEAAPPAGLVPPGGTARDRAVWE